MFKPTPVHLPVLLDEVLAALDLRSGQVVIDGTLGLGGHSEAILTRQPDLRIIGIDQDQQALALTKERLGDKIEYLQSNFAQMDQVLANYDLSGVDGILLDLGVSSLQLDSPQRGFSFQQIGPLDMRMDQTNWGDTAADILNSWNGEKLIELFYNFGEERFTRRIVRAILEQRSKHPFRETQELATLIVACYPPALRYKHPHPATRVFQALRMAVNQEMSVLEEGLKVASQMLNPNGRLVVISFHSLEDRLVKHFFRQQVQSGGYSLLFKKVIIAQEEEIRSNPRSRSAKLRVLIKRP
jgi:16S rRNA (cytosine1402-N4)-methyltransferase